MKNIERKEDIMGQYNKEYESYYKSVIKNKRNTSIDKYNDVDNIAILGRRKSSNLNILNTIIISTVGSAILCGTMYICKNSENGNEIYSYMKKVCSTNFYYKKVLDARYSNSKVMSNETVKKEVSSYKDSSNVNIKAFDNFQVIKKNKEELLKENGILPVEKITAIKTTEHIADKHIIIETEESSIKAMLDGKVTDIKKNDKNEEFIVINHGDGVETYYGNLIEINKKVGEDIKEGEKLGKIKENPKEKVRSAILQIKINGEFKEPKDYIELK